MEDQPMTADSSLVMAAAVAGIDMVVVVVMAVDPEGTPLLLEGEDHILAPGHAQDPQDGPGLQGGALHLHVTINDHSLDHLIDAPCLHRGSPTPEADLAQDPAAHVHVHAVEATAAPTVEASPSRRILHEEEIAPKMQVLFERESVVIHQHAMIDHITYGFTLAD